MGARSFTNEQWKAAFWRLVDKRGPDECWPWQGGMKSKTVPNQMYGVYGIRGTQRNASRVAWMFTHGEPAKGLDVCHTCDNPRCCNPAHLWLGTEADNSHDKLRKGRDPTPVLTPVQVREIRELLGKLARREIAAQYKVKTGVIANLAQGRTYAWVE